MFYLVLATISSALVSITMKLSEKGSGSLSLRLASNYLSCFLLGLVLEGGNMDTRSSGLLFTLLLSFSAGSLYLFSFKLLNRSIISNGIGLSGLFMKLGLIVPVLFSVLFFNEQLTFMKLSALLLILFSSFLLNRRKEGENISNLVLLLLLLFFGGLSDLPLKIFQEFGSTVQRGLFLPIAFLTSFLISSFGVISEKDQKSLRDVLLGVLIGIPNYFSAYFLLQSLYSIDASIAYPFYSGLTVIILFLVGKIVFKDRMDKKEIIPILLLFLSMLMLSIA